MPKMIFYSVSSLQSEKLVNTVQINWACKTDSDSLWIIGRWPPPRNIDQEATGHTFLLLCDCKIQTIPSGLGVEDWMITGWMKYCNQLQQTVQCSVFSVQCSVFSTEIAMNCRAALQLQNWQPTQVTVTTTTTYLTHLAVTTNNYNTFHSNNYITNIFHS